MVQQRPAGPQQTEQRLRVHVDLGFADVLGHADARDRVKRRLRQLPVVLHADLDLLAEARLRDALARELGLRLGQRDADHLHAVLARGVDREAAPAAADVEHAHARRQAELARDQLEFRALRVLRASARPCEKIAQLYVIDSSRNSAKNSLPTS